MPTPRAARRALNHAVLVSTRSPSNISVPTVTISALFMFCPSRTLLSYTKVARIPFRRGESDSTGGQRLSWCTPKSHQGDVVLLLPALSSEGVELFHQEVHQRPLPAVLGDERSQLGEAEHLASGVMGLYEPIAVEEGRLATLQDDLLLLISHPRHQSQGHPPCPEFFGITVTVHVRQVVACVGVEQASALGVENGVEAGYEHVGWYAGKERLVDPLKYFAGRIV